MPFNRQKFSCSSVITQFLKIQHICTKVEVHGQTNRKGGGTKPITQKGLNLHTKGSSFAIIDLDLDHNVNRLPPQHCIMLTCRYLALVCLLKTDCLCILKVWDFTKNVKFSQIVGAFSSLDFKQETQTEEFPSGLSITCFYNSCSYTTSTSEVMYCAVSTVCFSLSLTLASVTHPSPP